MFLEPDLGFYCFLVSYVKNVFVVLWLCVLLFGFVCVFLRFG